MNPKGAVHLTVGIFLDEWESRFGHFMNAADNHKDILFQSLLIFEIVCRTGTGALAGPSGSIDCEDLALFKRQAVGIYFGILPFR